MTIIIQGFSSTDKVPGFIGETVYGAGPISIGSIPLKCLCVGLGGGTLTADGAPVQVLSTTDADTVAGAGTELDRMLRKALLTPGVQLWAAKPAPANTPAAAEATITFATTATSAGVFSYYVGGDLVSVGVATGDVIGDIASNCADAINARSDLIASATHALGVVTLAVKSAGARGNQAILAQDISAAPGGTTSTLAGGTAVTGGGVPFALGTGTEDLAALLTTIYPGQFDRIAFAQNDTTNAAKIKAHLIACAGPLEGRTQHAVVAVNSTIANAATLAQSTYNAERVQVLWLKNSETHPSEIAASFASYRTAVEQSAPNAAYDGTALPGVTPQRFSADWPSRATQQTALNEGITPVTSGGGDATTARVVRSITTKCLNGSDPDYRTLDTADAYVPDYVRNVLRLAWTTDYLPSNPYVGPNPSSVEPDPPAGVATPTRWNSYLTSTLAGLVSTNVLQSVGTTSSDSPVSEYDATARRIMSAVPVIRRANNHQTGVSVRQAG